LLFGEVGTAYVAYGAFLAEAGEEIEHFRGYILGREALLDWQLINWCLRKAWLGCAYPTGGCEGAIDIEEADGILERTVLERCVRRGRGKSHCEILW
jgi:hypothetical protein